MINHWDDFGIILVLLFANAVIGFWHHQKSENAVELLKQKLALNARVLRDNQWIGIDAKKVVPGDVIRIRYGDIIPADVKLFGCGSLQIEKITGKASPIIRG